MKQHITNTDTQSYGSRLSAAMRRLFPEAGPMQTFIVWVADQVDLSTATVQGAMTSQRTVGSSRSATAEEKIPTVRAARNDLKAFVLHLTASKSDAENPWDGDVQLFVPGGMNGVSRGARAVRDALAGAIAQIEDDRSVPERARWTKRLRAHVATLTALVDRGDELGMAHQRALSEQHDEKRSWLRVYRAASLILQGCLMLAGREDEYVAAVPHRNVRGARKRPAPPAPAP